MTTVKVKFRPSSVAGRPGRIVYNITRHRIVRQITTSYQVFPSEWDDKQSKIIPYQQERMAIAQSITQSIYYDMERLRILIAKYDNLPYDYSSDDVITEFQRFRKESSLFFFAEQVIARLKQLHHIGTADNYCAALNRFKQFRNNEDVPIEAITYGLIENYQEYLRSSGLAPNSISFYMRILRAIYNRAVNQDLTSDKKPFRTVFTGIEKTKKRAISTNDIRQLRTLDLSSLPHLAFARDIFMFLFFCRGMSFIDAAFLKKTDVCNGVISYRRRKTGQLLHIKMVHKISELVERHSIGGSPYLLPIITRPGYEERKQYESALRRTNNSLKVLSRLVHLPIPLTTYVSRHTWATMAKRKNIPLHVIADALGHDSVMTTQIYLSSIDASVIDKANNIIIGDL